jgi:hypothetical protein
VLVLPPDTIPCLSVFGVGGGFEVAEGALLVLWDQRGEGTGHGEVGAEIEGLGDRRHARGAGDDEADGFVDPGDEDGIIDR